MVVNSNGILLRFVNNALFAKSQLLAKSTIERIHQLCYNVQYTGGVEGSYLSKLDTIKGFVANASNVTTINNHSNFKETLCLTFLLTDCIKVRQSRPQEILSNIKHENKVCSDHGYCRPGPGTN